MVSKSNAPFIFWTTGLDNCRAGSPTAKYPAIPWEPGAWVLHWAPKASDDGGLRLAADAIALRAVWPSTDVLADVRSSMRSPCDGAHTDPDLQCDVRFWLRIPWEHGVFHRIFVGKPSVS